MCIGLQFLLDADLFATAAPELVPSGPPPEINLPRFVAVFASYRRILEPVIYDTRPPRAARRTRQWLLLVFSSKRDDRVARGLAPYTPRHTMKPVSVC
jgi:hypothetical protein